MIKNVIYAAFAALLPVAASASSIISDGNVSLGVDDLGQLNVSGGTADIYGTTAVGVRWVDPATSIEYESTSHGCLCEGWGLAVDGTAGFANNSTGTGGLTLISFSSTATTATSVVQITGTDVYVTHNFALSAATDDLFKVSVSVENRGATDVASLEYRRVMDWDASPTPFYEYVSIVGTATTTLLASSSDNGFVSSNPLSSIGVIDGACSDADCIASGPADHGAAFDFDLGGLLAGDK